MKLKLKGVFFLEYAKKPSIPLLCVLYLFIYLFIYLSIYLFIYLFIYLYILPHKINITVRKRKNITKIANLQGRKSYKK